MAVGFSAEAEARGTAVANAIADLKRVGGQLLTGGGNVPVELIFTQANVVTKATQLEVGKLYEVDSSAGGFPLTMPPADSPIGSRVHLWDAKFTWDKNPCTLNTNGAAVGVIVDATWRFDRQGAYIFEMRANGWRIKAG